jgi:hypothetical protein
MFIHDLRSFGRDQYAQNHLNDTKHEYYLGGVYFNSPVINKILELAVGNGILKSELDKLSKRKIDRGACIEMHRLEHIHQELEQMRRFSIGPVRDKLCREEVLAIIILPCMYGVGQMLPMHPKLQLEWGEKQADVRKKACRQQSCSRRALWLLLYVRQLNG